MPANPKLAAALEAVRRGFSVFPIIENGKSPAIENWQNLATTDPAQITRWWSANPRANIGTPTDGRLVFDIDLRKGGLESFQALQLQYDFPKTLRTVTASGGAHVIYARPPQTSIRNSAGELGDGLDIRADGGLIVLPGSSIGDKQYVWGNDRPPAVAPPDIIALGKTRRPKQAAAGTRIAEEDEVALDAAWDWLQAKAPRASLGNLKDTTYRVACQLYDYGLTEETCVQYLRAWGDSHCDHPLEDDTIASTARHALQYRGNAVGSKHPNAPGFEPVAIDESKRPAEQVNLKRARLYRLKYQEASDLALTESGDPLIEGLIDRKAMSVWYGESGGGKTFIMLDVAWHVAAGREWAGLPVVKGAVVYVAAEGGRGILKRVRALRERYTDATDVHLFLVPCAVDLLRADADLKPLVAEILAAQTEAGRKVELVVVDTLSRAIAGGNENDSQDMGRFVGHLDYIREAVGAHVAVVHHTGKDKARGARGHSLLRAATDTEVEIDDRVMNVTKQRDTECDIRLPFTLRPARLGTSAAGKDVISCTVDMHRKGDPIEPVALTATEDTVMQSILYGVGEKTETPFDWQFVSDSAAKLGSDIGSDIAFKRQALAAHLSHLSEKGWLKNLGRNQYVVTMSDNVRTCQKVLQDRLSANCHTIRSDNADNPQKQPVAKT